jgi:hypothetical protein
VPDAAGIEIELIPPSLVARRWIIPKQKMLANPTDAALSTELAEAVDRARVFAEASKAAATRKAYASDLWGSPNTRTTRGHLKAA